MTYPPLRLAAIGALTLASAQAGLAQSSQPGSRMSFPTPAGPDPIAREGIIEDGAVDALKEMSNFLMSAKTLEADAQGKPRRRNRRTANEFSSTELRITKSAGPDS